MAAAAHELSAAARELAGLFADEEFNKFYLGADTDGDGQVSADELQDFLQRTTKQGLTPRFVNHA